MKNGKIKEYSLRTVKVFGVVLAIVLIGKLLRYILVDDSTSYTRIMLHELYSQDENIDVLFLGSSHVYRSIDTKIMDRMLNCNTFNAGTSSQRLDGSYTLLKEVCKYNDIKEVYLDMYYWVMQEPDDMDEMNPVETYIISDYMRPSLNKYTYIAESTNKETWPNGYILARREWEKIFDIESVKKTIDRKRSIDYKEFKYIENEDEYYAGKGYVASYALYKPFEDSLEELKIMEKGISDESSRYLSKIISICKRKGIRLTLISVPMTSQMLSHLEDYSEYERTIKSIAETNEIEYWDFNIMENARFEDESDFKDKHHLNKNGAEKFSVLLAEHANNGK